VVATQASASAEHSRCVLELKATDGAFTPSELGPLGDLVVNYPPWDGERDDTDSRPRLPAIPTCSPMPEDA
jgi:hypothetical protein